MNSRVTPTRRQKVVIVGGGVGSMTTALELTATPELRERYELHVYQQGWRLGGKGASGRNPAIAQRIEEHGLHIWSGFYVNAFRVMRAVYEEADRPADCPLRTFEDAFKPHNTVSWQEHYLGKWKHWTVEMEHRPDEKPGEPEGPIPTPFRLLLRIGPWALEFLRGIKRNWHHSKWREAHPTASRPIAGIVDATRLISALVSLAFVYFTHQIIHFAARLMGRPTPTRPDQAMTGIGAFLIGMQKRILRRVESQPDILRLFILMDAAFCIFRGVLLDGVLWRGFDCIDRYDFREWLLRNGAIPEITVHSGLVRGTYDYIFAYIEGDTRRPSLAAGVALRMTLRLLLTYQQSIFWRMQAGMGDTIFAPMYEVLKKRGVKFHFFHQIENLGLSQDGKAIATVRVGRQVTLAGNRSAWEYEPLVDIKKVPCWPSEPRYEQIDAGEAARLRAQPVDLCSAWTDWRCPETFTLEVGKDFDLVVLGASLAALPLIAPELLAPGRGSENLRRMHEKVKTVQTLAFQLWLNRDARGLGWHQGPTILTAYAQPYDTWADMTHLDAMEDWPETDSPKNIAYFCGPLRESKNIPPVGGSPEFQVNQQLRARRIARTWLTRHTVRLWPDAAMPTPPRHLNWSLLVHLENGTGTERFESQYFRANVNPSDRYVISLPGTTEFRLRAGESGYANLYLTGDWLRTGLNYGCVEGTVMGGMQAAREICGSPKEIYGETDFCRVK